MFVKNKQNLSGNFLVRAEFLTDRSVAGAKLWNSLKTNITTINKICVFKKMWTSYFLGKYVNNT